MKQDTNARFNRTEILIGEAGLKKLAEARIVVCGLGAVGSYAVEALARAGVGYLRIVDYDTVDITNINRQLFALESTIGMKKAHVAEQRIKDINPACHVDVMDAFVNEETNPAVMEEPVDVIIDAIDSLSPKVHLIANAVRAGIFVVSSMGAAGRMDTDSIITGDISETRICPLARSVRRRLRKQNIESGVRCVFSTEEALKKQDEHQIPHDGQRTAPVLGSISFMTGIFGLKVAGEAINHLLKPETILKQ